MERGGGKQNIDRRTLECHWFSTVWFLGDLGKVAQFRATKIWQPKQITYRQPFHLQIQMSMLVAEIDYRPVHLRFGMTADHEECMQGGK